jgi:hypothetical protein
MQAAMAARRLSWAASAETSFGSKFDAINAA